MYHSFDYLSSLDEQSLKLMASIDFLITFTILFFRKKSTGGWI